MVLDYKAQAREMLLLKLLQDPDEGVQAMAAAFDPPEESVNRIAAALEARDRRNAN